jgi:hypothetical protein
MSNSSKMFRHLLEQFHLYHVLPLELLQQGLRILNTDFVYNTDFEMCARMWVDEVIKHLTSPKEGGHATENQG